MTIDSNEGADTVTHEENNSRSEEKKRNFSFSGIFSKATLVQYLPHARLLGIGFLAGALVLGLTSGETESPPKHDMSAMAGAKDAPPSGEGAASQWTCSMHPQIQRGEPGSCPICGMDLIKVQGNDAAEDDGPRKITLSKRAQVLAKLRTTTVQRNGQSAGELRLLGRVEPNEKTLKMVTAWTGGRIDRLYVNTTGEQVRGGQVIATLYSPEIFAAHQDLLSASAQVKRMSSAVESSRLAAGAARDAARQRLSLLGVPDSELARMENQKKPTTAVPIRTPFGGTVMERFATEGSYVTTGARLYSIAKLSTLWIQLDAYESDIPLLKLEQNVRVEVDAFPGENFEGEITFIDPTLDPRKRTSRVRVEVDNKDGRLRPGMFAQAIVAAETEKADNAPLVIPASAPLFTGRRAVVYVEVTHAERTTYEARTVRLGPRLGNFYPVVAGLSEGERIVQRGAFALDADLQIRGGKSMMASPDDQQAGQWDNVVHVPRADLKSLAPVFKEYLNIQQALGSDDLKKSQKAANELKTSLKKVKFSEPPQGERMWKTHSPMLDSHSTHIIKSTSIEEARAGFEGLSGSIIMLLRRVGNPLKETLFQAFCPMAAGSRGASWVQVGEKVFNPYFGSSMLDCGEVTRSVDPGGHLSSPDPSDSAAPSKTPAGGHNH